MKKILDTEALEAIKTRLAAAYCDNLGYEEAISEACTDVAVLLDEVARLRRLAVETGTYAEVLRELETENTRLREALSQSTQFSTYMPTPSGKGFKAGEITAPFYRAVDKGKTTFRIQHALRLQEWQRRQDESDLAALVKGESNFQWDDTFVKPKSESEPDS